jgi:hypothetical protein
VGQSGPGLATRWGVDELLPPSLDTIVLDDSPMIVDDGAVLVEDDAAVASVAEPFAVDDDSVIEVGDEVVFDS